MDTFWRILKEKKSQAPRSAKILERKTVALGWIKNAEEGINYSNRRVLHEGE